MDIKSLIIIIALAEFFIAGLIYFRGKRQSVDIVFALLNLSAGLWAISLYFYEYPLLLSRLDWIRITYFFSLFLTFFVFYFSLIFLSKKTKKLILFLGLYVFLAIPFFYILFFTDLWIKDVIIHRGSPHTVLGPSYVLFIIYTGFFFLWSIANLAGKFLASSGINRERLKYILYGIILGGLGILIPSGVIPLIIGSTDYFWTSPVLLVFFVGLTAYVITRYRLMDITVATGKVATYLFTFLTIGFFGYAMTVFFSYFEVLHAYQVIAVALLAGIFFRPLFLAYESFSSYYLYHSFYSSQKVLGELSEKLTKILDIDELADLTTKTIMDTMKLDRAVILLRDEKTGKFDIKRNFGFKEENGISLVSDSFLTEHLLKTQKPLVYEELSLMIDSTDKEMEKRKIRKLKENMERIEAALCNLLVSREKVIGMIVLGEKISKDPYTDQDVNLIDNLCKQISISVENAKLYSQVEDLKNNLEERVEEQVKELKKAYKKLQRIDKAKTEFMSIVSHQLRTPLSIIKGHLSMVTEGVYEDNREKEREVLENVYEANERLIDLVNDVLNVSRIQAGRVEMHTEEKDLAEVVKNTIERIRPSVNGKNVDLVFEKPSEELSKIEIDVSKIENALLNLIDNALKYTKQGEVRLSLKEEESSLLVEIKDTGEGMSKEELEKLFETFSRGDAGKKHWIQGAGLGLYIARQFIEMHEGEVWAHSEGIKKGSQFYVRLPL